MKNEEEISRLRDLEIAEEDLNNLRKSLQDELEADKMAYLRRINRFENNFANAASSTLRTGMNQAFDDIFGHANSLLEIFLQNLVSGMATDLATQAGEGIFSWLTGGIGSIFSGLFSMQGNKATKKTFITNINIDGQKIMSAVVKPNLPSTLDRLTETRFINA